MIFIRFHLTFIGLHSHFIRLHHPRHRPRLPSPRNVNPSIHQNSRKNKTTHKKRKSHHHCHLPLFPRSKYCLENIERYDTNLTSYHDKPTIPFPIGRRTQEGGYQYQRLVFLKEGRGKPSSLHNSHNSHI